MTEAQTVSKDEPIGIDEGTTDGEWALRHENYELREFVAVLQRIVEGLTERAAGQSELLSRRAMKK